MLYRSHTITLDTSDRKIQVLDLKVSWHQVPAAIINYLLSNTTILKSLTYLLTTNN